MNLPRKLLLTCYINYYLLTSAENEIILGAVSRKEENLVRQTTLTLQELLDELSNPDSEYRACMLANEIGELATEDKEAYRNLHTVLLSHANPEVRYVGVCYLAKMGQCDEEVLLAMGKVSIDMSIPRPIRRTAIMALLYLLASRDNGSQLPWEQFEKYREEILEGKR